MNTLIVTLLVLVFLALIVVIVMGSSHIKKSQNMQQVESLGESLRMLLTHVNDLSGRIDARIGESTQTMHESIHKQTHTQMQALQGLAEKLIRLDETNKQVVGFAEQLQSLQDMLKNPKQRGILGEFYLETTLKNTLPPNSYQMQYRLTDSDIVDAVVFVKEKIIPIDSKFSLENYNRISGMQPSLERERYEKLFKADLKMRIDETSKYIQPENGTMDFAFMFIPHEAIYYDLLVAEIGGVKVNTQDLIQYAFKKKVLIVSPTSFLAFLQTVLQGLRALQIEESAKEIQKRVFDLSRHLAAFEDYHTKLGKTLATTVNHYNGSTKEFKKIDKDIVRITGDSMKLELEMVDKPSFDE